MRALGVRMKLNPLPREHRGQAPRRRRRLDRPGHHHPGDHRDAARGGRRRGAPAGLVAALPLAVLLRHGHRPPRRAARRQHDVERDPRLPRAPTRSPTSTSTGWSRATVRRSAGVLRRRASPATTRSRSRWRSKARARGPSAAHSELAHRRALWRRAESIVPGRHDRRTERRQLTDERARPTRAPGSTRRRRGGGRAHQGARSARRTGPRCSATSAGSAGCSRSLRPATREPVLVSSTDGVGTKALVAQRSRPLRHDRHRPGRDVRRRHRRARAPSRCSSSTTSSLGSLDPGHVEQLVAGVAEGCRQAGCALIGGEMAEHPGAHGTGGVRSRRLRGGRRRAGTVLITGGGDAGRRADRSAVPGLRSNGYSLARHVLLERGRSPARRSGLGRAPTPPLGDELLRAVGDLRPGRAGRDCGLRSRFTPSPTSPAAGSPATCPGCSRPSADAVVDPGPLGGAAHLRRDPTPRRVSRTPRWQRCSTSASA